jgi:hypothetical protein
MNKSSASSGRNLCGVVCLPTGWQSQYMEYGEAEGDQSNNMMGVAQTPSSSDEEEPR